MCQGMSVHPFRKAVGNPGSQQQTGNLSDSEYNDEVAEQLERARPVLLVAVASVREAAGWPRMVTDPSDR